MEVIKSTSDIKFEVILKLSEEEARALLALTEYGTKSFLEYFYKTLGREGLQPHEKGLITLFETVKTEIPKHINKFNKIKELWNS